MPANHGSIRILVQWRPPAGADIREKAYVALAMLQSVATEGSLATKVLPIVSFLPDSSAIACDRYVNMGDITAGSTKTSPLVITNESPTSNLTFSVSVMDPILATRQDATSSASSSTGSNTNSSFNKSLLTSESVMQSGRGIIDITCTTCAPVDGAWTLAPGAKLTLSITFSGSFVGRSQKIISISNLSNWFDKRQVDLVANVVYRRTDFVKFPDIETVPGMYSLSSNPSAAHDDNPYNPDRTNVPQTTQTADGGAGKGTSALSIDLGTMHVDWDEPTLEVRRELHVQSVTPNMTLRLSGRSNLMRQVILYNDTELTERCDATEMVLKPVSTRTLTIVFKPNLGSPDPSGGERHFSGGIKLMFFRDYGRPSLVQDRLFEASVGFRGIIVRRPRGDAGISDGKPSDPQPRSKAVLSLVHESRQAPEPEPKPKATTQVNVEQDSATHISSASSAGSTLGEKEVSSEKACVVQ